MTGDRPSSLQSTVAERLRSAGCVFAEDEARLLVEAAATAEDLEASVRRRVAGEPLEHLLGWAEFCGLRVAVGPGVFVPRRRTGLLVDEAVALAPLRPVVLDLCCGAGAIGVALAARVDAVELHAADVDGAAVRCARRNVTRGDVYEGDLYSPLPTTLRGRVDLLVVNAPYVPTDAIATMPREARLYEARVALDGGSDGVDVQRRVVAGSGEWLAPGGHLLIETSARQAPGTADVMKHHGLVSRTVHSDEVDGTVVIGSRRGD